MLLALGNKTAFIIGGEQRGGGMDLPVSCFLLFGEHASGLASASLWVPHSFLEVLAAWELKLG